jgi:hypothetical protein
MAAFTDTILAVVHRYSGWWWSLRRKKRFAIELTDLVAAATRSGEMRQEAAAGMEVARLELCDRCRGLVDTLFTRRTDDGTQGTPKSER